jgi:hypothetical protein
MERREFKTMASEVSYAETRYAPIMPTTRAYHELYVLRNELRIRLALMGEIAVQALAGTNWASIIARVRNDSPAESNALYDTMLCANEALQQDGFQTDTARYRERSGTPSYSQMTIFLNDGKQTYSDELHKLGVIDHPLLDLAMIGASAEMRPLDTRLEARSLAHLTTYSLHAARTASVSA